MSVLEQERPVDALADDPWWVWLEAIIPNHCTHPFAEHHQQFWDWLWAIEPGVRPEAFVGIWPRGGAKSTSAEAGTVALGARQKRRYGLYVCDTQDRADDHVSTIGSMLESERVELFYPDLSERRVGKHGNSRGWRRNRLWTSDGFVVDAIGLDTAARGVKLEDQRPDFLVIDDIDSQHDSAKITRKKVETLTGAVIPAGSEDLAILAIQNLIHPTGVFAQLAGGKADFLRRRLLSGPVPALTGFHVDADGQIHGEPTWVGQSLERCRELADDIGVRAFKREAQHEVADVEGALWKQEQIEALRVTAAPESLARVVTGVDPAASSKEKADDTGIVTVGASEQRWCPECGPVEEPHLFVLADRSAHASPARWGRIAIGAHDQFGGDRIVGETNNGGEMVELTLRVVDEAIPYKAVHASRGKRTRAEPAAALSGDPADPDSWPRGRVHFVGHLPELEGQLCTWVPDMGMDSPDRLDAFVWAVTELALGKQRRSLTYRGEAA